MGNEHENHRSRLRERFINEGLDNFELHNILELLMFYSIPRRDTNVLAHKLIDKYKTLSGVFDADIRELTDVDGVGQSTAVFFKLIPQVARRYMLEAAAPGKCYDTARKIGNYFVAQYTGVTVEKVYMLLLNASYGIISCEKLNDGSVNSAHITTRSVIEHAVKSGASMAVLAHNHPNGIAIPSSEDISTTRLMHEALSLVDVRLLEHFVVSGDKYMPIMSGSLGTLNQSLGEEELRRFYSD